MTFLRASAQVNPHTTMMAADVLRIRRGAFDGRGRIEMVDDRRIRMHGSSVRTTVSLPGGPLDVPGDHQKRLDAQGWRTLVGRCRRACIRHSEIGLPVTDEEIAIDVAVGLLEIHAGILRDDDRITVQVPSPWSPLRYRMGTASMPIGGPAILPSGWSIPHKAMLELICERNLDLISVSLQPIAHVWYVHEIKSMDPVLRMRALARLRGLA